MNNRHIIFVPGKNPKPPLEQHRRLLWRTLLEGIRRSDPGIVDDSCSAQRMRFMHIYLGHDRLTDKDKQLIQQILERARPMWERQLKRLERSIAVDENGKPTGYGSIHHPAYTGG